MEAFVFALYQEEYISIISVAMQFTNFSHKHCIVDSNEFNLAAQTQNYSYELQNTYGTN